MEKIKVTYGSVYPGTCYGTLTVEKDGVIVYHEEDRLYVDGDGSVAWLDAADFAQDIQVAVAKRLSTVEVYYGGCY